MRRRISQPADIVRVCWPVVILSLILMLCLPAGCPLSSSPVDDANSLVFHNTSDPTNGGAEYIGSAACGACHPSVVTQQRIHGHSHALTPIQGQAPQYAPEGTRAGVPNPPTGMTWNDISYVISGYLHGAFFVDQAGFVATDGVLGVNTQWLLDFPPNGTEAGFAAYLPDQATPKPYDYETCFRCHTTGPQPQNPDDPRSQDGRPGILGTWAEHDVQCEACHGPGSAHVPDPQARNIFVDSTPQTCGRCHDGGVDPNMIPAADGFLQSNTQYSQLLASGGHSGFNCTICHNPHASITYDREHGLRNECTDCHTDANMAFHDGAVFEFGNYTETVNCESCHMPLVGMSDSSASATLVGPEARIGDVRGHIFRINTMDLDYHDMLTTDGSAVLKDSEGRAAVTVDFVCLRCHNQSGNVFPLTLAGARLIADGMHERAASAE